VHKWPVYSKAGGSGGVMILAEGRPEPRHWSAIAAPPSRRWYSRLHGSGDRYTAAVEQ